jgi:hypothetical protein
MNKQRLLYALLLGAILGVFCIIGAQTRYTDSVSNMYLFGFWFNRVIIGLVIGVITVNCSLKKSLIRGFALGLIVSFAFYSSTEFYDLIGFLVGGVYGMIIEFTLYKIENKKIIGGTK